MQIQKIFNDLRKETRLVQEAPNPKSFMRDVPEPLQEEVEAAKKGGKKKKKKSEKPLCLDFVEQKDDDDDDFNQKGSQGSDDQESEDELSDDGKKQKELMDNEDAEPAVAEQLNVPGSEHEDSVEAAEESKAGEELLNDSLELSLFGDDEDLANEGSAAAGKRTFS